MVGAVAVHVIPEVVAENGEEGIVVFPQSQAVLVVAKVIGLPIVPVKPVADNKIFNYFLIKRSPFNGRVHVIPSPGARRVDVVVSLWIRHH